WFHRDGAQDRAEAAGARGAGRVSRSVEVAAAAETPAATTGSDPRVDHVVEDRPEREAEPDRHRVLEVRAQLDPPGQSILELHLRDRQIDLVLHPSHASADVQV